MFNRLKTLLIITLGIGILLSGFSFSRPKFKPPTTYASVPTMTVTDAPRKADNILEKFVQKAFSSLKKSTLKGLIHQTIKSIQSGQGNTGFVTDWTDLLSKAGRKGILAALPMPGENIFCQPFKVQIYTRQNALAQPSNDLFAQQAKCTIADVYRNIQNFAKDLRNGSWYAYNTIYEPQNNFVGISLMSDYQMLDAKGTKQNAELARAIAGGGFLGTEDATGQITTPGSITKDRTSKALTSDFDTIINAKTEREIADVVLGGTFDKFLGNKNTGIKSASVDQQNEISNMDTDAKNSIKKEVTDTRDLYIGQFDEILTPRQTASSTITDTIKLIDDFETYQSAAQLTTRYNTLVAQTVTKPITGSSIPQTQPKWICPPAQNDYVDQAQDIIDTTLENLATQFASSALEQFTQTSISEPTTSDLANMTINYLESKKAENDPYVNLLSDAKKQTISITANTTLAPTTQLDKLDEVLNILKADATTKGIRETILNIYSYNTSALQVATEFLAARRTEQTTIRDAINAANQSITDICQLRPWPTTSSP